MYNMVWNDVNINPVPKVSGEYLLSFKTYIYTAADELISIQEHTDYGCYNRLTQKWSIGCADEFTSETARREPMHCNGYRLIKLTAWAEKPQPYKPVNTDKMFEFAMAFHHIGTIGVQIIEYLNAHGFLNGGYSDLTRAIGRKTGVNGDEPNIRKWCKALELAGVITIVYNDGKRTVKQIILNPYWMNAVIHNYELIDSSIFTKQKQG